MNFIVVIAVFVCLFGCWLVGSIENIYLFIGYIYTACLVSVDSITIDSLHLQFCKVDKAQSIIIIAINQSINQYRFFNILTKHDFLIFFIFLYKFRYLFAIKIVWETYANKKKQEDELNKERKHPIDPSFKEGFSKICKICAVVVFVFVFD